MEKVAAPFKQLLPGNQQPKVAIVAMRIQTCPPYPSPAVTAPTPDEVHLLVQAQRAQKAAQFQDQMSQGKEEVKGSAGKGIGARLWGVATVVKAFAQRTLVDAQTSTARSLRDVTINRDLHTFVREFPAIAELGATFMAAYECQVVHQGVPMDGKMFICSSHICFAGSVLCDVIPFTEVAALALSVWLPTKTGTPFLIGLPSARVKPTAIQVYTTHQLCYQFLGFSSGVLHRAADHSIAMEPIDACYNVLDHTWRSAVTVPLLGVSYGDSAYAQATEAAKVVSDE